jgi:hypothetical protein
MEDVVLNCSACPRDLSPGMVRPEQPDPQCLLFQRLSVRHATATTSSPSVSGKCSEVPSNSGICRPFADRGRTRRVASALEGVDGSSPSEGFEIREKPANRLVLLSESAPQGTSLTVEVRERHARTRATTRDTVSPANRAEWRLEDASRDVARVVSDVSVLCPRVVVEIGNDPTSLRPSRCSQRRGLRSGSAPRERPRARLRQAISVSGTHMHSSARRDETGEICRQDRICAPYARGVTADARPPRSTRLAGHAKLIDA